MSTSLSSINRYGALLLVSLLSTSCLSVGDQAKFKATRHSTVPYPAASSLSVVTQNGAVTVDRIDGAEVKIEATLRCTSQERLDATTVIAGDKDGTLSIGVAWADGKPLNNEGCDLKISIPSANGVTIQTGNGAITIAGLSGTATLKSSNGTVTVKDHDGDVAATTSNGRITLAHVSGKLDARTSNGSIDIDGATASVVAVTSNGSIDASLSDGSAGPVKLRSSNSNVRLMVGKSFAGSLSATTSNGGVDLDQLPGATVVSTGRHSAKLAFGDSDAVSEVFTSNGSIKISKTKTQ